MTFYNPVIDLLKIDLSLNVAEASPTTILKFTDDILEALNDGECMVGVFLDLNYLPMWTQITKIYDSHSN